MIDMEYKYFKPPQWDGKSNIYAYLADGSQDAFIFPELVRMTDDEVIAYYERVNTPSQESVETAWRDSEINVVKDNLEALLFDDPDALPGTDAEWKAYGVALRRWKEGAEGWPDSARRPARPA